MRETERGETNRRRGSKVMAHFKHFPEKDPVIVANCKRRVSRLTPQDLTKQANSAIQQRSKLFQRWFWVIVNNHIIRTDLPGNSICDDALFFRGEFSDFELGKNLTSIIDNFKNNIQLSINESEHFLNFFKKNSSSYIKACESNGNHNDVLKPFFEQMAILSKSRLHKQIVQEALLFLSNKRNRDLLRAIVVWLFISTETKLDYLCNKFNEIGETRTLVHREVGKFLTLIPWAEEFNNLKKGKETNTKSYAGLVYTYLQNAILSEAHVLI
jgi:hypothetical protein